jgi:glycosyltransferase involved in cell wall biosynthesis
MNLLFVIKSLAVRGGGAERVLADLTAELAARGHVVTIATFDAAGVAPFYAFAPGVKLLRLGIGDASRKTRSLDLLRRIRGLSELLLQLRPDAAIGFMHSAYVPLAVAARGTGVPAVGSEHTVYSHYRGKFFDRLSLRLAARHLAAITATSRSMAEGFPAAFRRRVRVIANPVASGGARSSDVEGGAAKTLLAVGRLEDEKDHATLVSAFAHVADRFSDWRLRIVGEGSLRETLQRQVEQSGLAERIELAGSTPGITKEYASADVFVMPSKYESFGLACAEALAAGLPAIGFADCAGTNELIKPGRNGLLVEGVDRVAALANGLSELMASAALRRRLGAAGPASVAAFRLRAIASSWEELLREHIGKSQCAA